MDANIRDHIINNFTNDKSSVLKSAIEESIKEGDEITLPGMGVFFEILWADSTKTQQNDILKILVNRFKKKAK